MNAMQKCTLAWLFLCCVATLLDTRPVRADPVVKCDSQCRTRQYFYIASSGTYKKYYIATCELCVSTGLCKADANDLNTAATCTTKAGGETGNKYWFISSKTVCDFTNEFYIEAEAADQTDQKSYVAADKYCPPKPDPDPNGS